MDTYISLGGQEEPVPPVPAIKTLRRFRKAGCIGVLFVGCGVLWQAALTAFAKGGETPYEAYNITGVYTEADLVKVFGRGGPKPEHIVRRPQMLVSTHGEVDVDSDVNSHDIYQGQLGDCWFDSALAAISHRHKDSIIAMFEHIDMHQGIFRTRWFIGGRWVTVAVNAEIPVKPDRPVPFFLWTSSELTLWPAILEKSFAKLVGSYKAIEGGAAREAFQYILGVPVQYIHDRTWRESPGQEWSDIEGATDLDDVWNQIVHALDNHYPMGVGTGPRGGFHGIDGGHAYTLYDYASNFQGHGRSVRVRNPWGVNRYNGTITGQTNTIGDFWITWDEFTRNYVSINIALMPAGYQSQRLADVPVSGLNSGGFQVSFHVSHNNNFSVQALWPSQRMIRSAHCQAFTVTHWTCRPAHTWICRTRLLLYRGSRGSGSPQIGVSTFNGYRVDGQGAGSWTVELAVDGSFPGLPEISLSTFMPGAGGFSLSLESQQQFLGAGALATRADDKISSLPSKVASLQPIETPSCSDYYGRMIHDLNGNVVPSDPQFPESMVSIGDAGSCGDAAHGFRESCSHYNHWGNMITVANTESDDLSCFSFTHQGGSCRVQNTQCNREVIFFCHIVGCEEEALFGGLNYYATRESACCGCNDPSNFR
jgi:hypothetical protein